jgi:hypothetical protein
MAFGTTVNRGTKAETTSGATIVLNPTGTIAAGSIADCVVAFDNLVNADQESTNCTVSDSVGNSWTRQKEYTNGSAGAGLGVGMAHYRSKITTPITATDTITAQLSAAVVARAMGVAETPIAGGNTVQVAGQDNAALNTTSTAPSGAISGLPSKEYFFSWAYGGETSTTTGTATNYTKVFSVTANTGVSDDSVTAQLFVRVLTGTGDSITGANFGTTRDKVLWYAASEEVAGGGLAIDVPDTTEMVFEDLGGWTVVNDTGSAVIIDVPDVTEMVMEDIGGSELIQNVQNTGRGKSRASNGLGVGLGL